MSELTLTELAPGLHRLLVPGGAAHLLNVYLWCEGTEVTLIDTGWAGSSTLIARALATLGRKPSDVARIILTHFHEDHAGAAAEIIGWGDVEVVAGADDASFVAGTSRGPLPVLTEAERSIHPESQDPPHGPACRVDRLVRDGDVLNFAGGARVIATPGHTPGSIALFLPEPGAVLTGDAVAELNGDVILGVFNVDRAIARASLTRIADTNAQIAGFGHGNPVLTEAFRRIQNATDPFAEPVAEPVAEPFADPVTREP
ncbi:MBL fold metallo-hydrolase [Lysinibacter cavernae]|uniref:Glyoxylase-like metal-dependent hydrolase (Beta-lactamase superfamily II) n=1 Tax=Lysinibacter cavernae TaxID=1640652 RepID=A0A7X5TSJ7_9MICO|nr:MBL fold metallo-hydrolase [Lysinibacter cavernae]NIH52494.1 glyoxylase-like metal-dependent hydrolase (beta-lactamase superfamily II) [Lysinibacter cavernae]